MSNPEKGEFFFLGKGKIYLLNLHEELTTTMIRVCIVCLAFLKNAMTVLIVVYCVYFDIILITF